MTEPGRKPGSARFATYYKVQVFNERNACWYDIQRTYATAEAARGAYPPGPALPGHGSDAARAAVDRVRAAAKGAEIGCRLPALRLNLDFPRAFCDVTRTRKG
jgi:hypothetical protein